MEKINAFLRTTVLGGFTVLLPVAIITILWSWLFKFVTNLIQPFTNFILNHFGLPKFVADVIVLVFIVVICFLIGLLIRTRTGKFLHNFFENRVLKVAPGYSIIKDTTLQLLGGKTLFSQVALIQLTDAPITTTAFISDTHSDGSYTVFIPMGPTPTSGFIYHLPAKYVHVIDVSVEDAMRSIITCGVGSGKLISAYQKNK